MIFGTPASKSLARRIARSARRPFGSVEFRTFADGERYVRVRSPVRGRAVVAVGSTQPPAGNLLDLLFLIRALRENGARRITAVIPYLAYARGDHVEKAGEFVPLRLVADLLEAAGTRRVVLVDPHPANAKRFFRVPLTVIRPLAELARRIKVPREAVVVAPDEGAAGRARLFASLLDVRRVAVFRKVRPRHDIAKIVAHTPVPRSSAAVIVDDLISTGGTVIAAIRALRSSGIRRITVAATHPVFADRAPRRIQKAGAERIIVCDTISHRRLPNVVRVAPVSRLIAGQL